MHFFVACYPGSGFRAYVQGQVGNQYGFVRNPSPKPIRGQGDSLVAERWGSGLHDGSSCCRSGSSSHFDACYHTIGGPWTLSNNIIDG